MRSKEECKGFFPSRDALPFARISQVHFNHHHSTEIRIDDVVYGPIVNPRR
jgi:hypothetical protein